ncbi:MAG: hypothetical protein IMZ69_08560 [Spirochaetes bacterium]|nr:hypothetical protein [Spirochaetota bacterium]
MLDLERLRDRATFFEPHQFPEGVKYVLVNGSFVVERRKLTWALPDAVLRPARILDKVPTGGNPDSIHYEASRREVWTMNGLGKSGTVFSATSGRVLATVPFPTRPECGSSAVSR